MTTEVVQKLEQASAGLLMMSESDYPFKVVSWKGTVQEALTPAKLLELTGHSQDAPVEIVDIDYFFRNCAVEKEWHNEQLKEQVKQFKILVDTIKSELSDISVYRVGTISIDVYIVGKTASNDLAGLATKVVET
ncbi:Nuclease A inhibitor-like protein (plasmid) [Cylindrospermum stagnale PCC 7417]|uniref:Nuclease A inhibitor-like protein n=1 Tax=Cylindrospermum stagnale PCC 7417 TaxID=56107 RepID=K9X8C8_9NOST|nr:nuclease A inhibitor family protein [Cylindrospermum stagnale]AFZ28326.1 Nuclease A inhibitor-like protein [Cylindrospermum stagnale PCC 7417]